MDFLREITGFGGEHAESVIGVSKSLGGVREFAELTLKVYLRMESKTSGVPKENQCFRW